MKKLMILTAATFFLLMGCAKVDITPDSNNASVSATTAPEAKLFPPLNGIYTITNTETDWGVVEYRVQFTDCDGNYQDVPLLMQESITVCLQNSEVTTNFAFTIVKVK